jgi:hypothetical protein
MGVLCAGLSMLFTACKKSAEPSPSRTIWYILYTKEDFASVKDTIRFRLRMQTTGTTGRVLLDSSIAPMKVSEIPDSLHRLVFTKNVPPGHEHDNLVVGFIYDIDNVGESWFLDSSTAGQRTKTVEYSFR